MTSRRRGVTRAELEAAARAREAEQRQADQLRDFEAMAAKRYVGVGVYATAEELEELRRLRLGGLLGDPRIAQGAVYRRVDELARERGLPDVPGHWGIHLETGEFLES